MAFKNVYSATRFVPDKNASAEQRILTAVEYVAGNVDEILQRLGKIEAEMQKRRKSLLG